MFPFFINKNIFTNYLRILFNIYRNYVISNSKNKAINFFQKKKILKDLKLSKQTWKPNYIDQEFLYKLILQKKISTVLEFGTGYSTIAMAAALKLIKKKSKIYCLETSKKWIVNVEKGLTKYKEYVEIIHSKCEMQLIGTSLGSIYVKLPNITPDLIYVDGPDPNTVKSKIFNLNYEKTNTPISADILLHEYRLKPGAIIVVDGRPNNVIFLKNNLKRKYKFQFQRLYSRSIFELQQ